jgi:hypothetical protein
LEIVLREETFRAKFFDAAFLYSQSLVLVKREQDKPNGTLLPFNALAHLCVMSVLAHHPVQAAHTIRADSGMALRADYKAYNQLPWLAYHRQWDNAINKPFCNAVEKDLHSLLLNFMIKLIDHHENKDRDRTVSSTLKEFLEKKELEDATEDLKDALDNVESHNENTLEDFMNQIAEKASSKQIQQMKSTLRKNCSGGAKTRPLGPPTMVKGSQ